MERFSRQWKELSGSTIQTVKFLDYVIKLKHSKCHVFNYEDKTGVAVILYTYV